jgi:primary-amine oxidase
MTIKRHQSLFFQTELGTSSTRNKTMSRGVWLTEDLVIILTDSIVVDFNFYISTGPAGVALHDIHFQGERIVYELGMQEALAHYAGPDRDQTFASYLDVNIGFTNFNQIPGYDCPSYATYKNAFCLFEYPKDFPMNRHQSDDYYHATKNVAFMVRSVSTVGNYDYQTTYEFYHDGSIQIIVRASGYIQGATLQNTTEDWDYGFHIRDQLSGSMHDHVLNFKLDLDIHGIHNSLFKTEFVPHTQVYEWSDGQPINTMKVERSFIDNEDQGKIHWAPNAAAAYAVVNKEKQNELGEYPGFRIYPSTGSSIHLTVENSSVFSNAVNWATHPLYVLQRKDSEPVSAHLVNAANPRNPMVDFNKFFDGESLDQEDLVLYFNLGMHHMPDTYDLPNTVFMGSQSGITIRPQNYLRSENSMSTRQQIHITNKNNNTIYETYGAKRPTGSFDLDSTNPDTAAYPSPCGECGPSD